MDRSFLRQSGCRGRMWAPYGPVGPEFKALSSFIPIPTFLVQHSIVGTFFPLNSSPNAICTIYALPPMKCVSRLNVNGNLDIPKGKVLCTLFYEPSTRTSSSFDAAMKRCSSEVVQTSVHASSVSKGESLPDTIRTLACYGDAITSVIQRWEVRY
jgi:hypothetical protein